VVGGERPQGGAQPGRELLTSFSLGVTEVRSSSGGTASAQLERLARVGAGPISASAYLRSATKAVAPNASMGRKRAQKSSGFVDWRLGRESSRGDEDLDLIVCPQLPGTFERGAPPQTALVGCRRYRASRHSGAGRGSVPGGTPGATRRWLTFRGHDGYPKTSSRGLRDR